MINANNITIEDIENGELDSYLPNFIEMKKCIENNPWHENISVFDHTIHVLKELNKLIRYSNKKIKKYLDKKINTCSKRDLLFLGTLFHDIGKIETLGRDRGITSCVNHEEIGGSKIPVILEKFKMSKKEKEIVIDIVRHHSEVQYILKPENKNIQKKYNNFKSNHEEIIIELILIAMADTLGSQTKKNFPKEFDFRINFCEKALRNTNS